MTVATPLRRIPAAFVAALLLLLGVPVLTGVAQASHDIVDVNPKGSVNGISTTIEVIGSGFQPSPATSVTLRRVGAPGDIISGTVIPLQSTPNVLRVSFNFTHMNPGVYDVFVTQNEPLATDDVLPGAFTLTASGAPTVTAVLDQTGDEPLGDITIRGTNFTRGSVVEFYVGGVKDNALTFARDDDTQDPTTISGHYSIVGSPIPGPHTVRVTHTDGSAFGQCVNCFSQPTIANLSQTSLGQGASNRQVVVNGDGLTGATASISGTGVTILSQSVPNDDQITMQVSVASNAAATARTVTVTHPSGGFYQLVNGLTITPRPTVSGLSPAALGQGALNATVTVSGANFSGSSFQFVPADGITINSATPVNGSTVNLNLTIAENAATGTRSLIVTNADFGTSTANDVFTINVGPKVTKVNPSSLSPGSNASVTIEGTNFDITEDMTLSFGPDITATITDVNLTGTQITASVSVAPGAAGGLRTVTVVDNDDLGRGTCVGCFGINTITVQGLAASTNNQIATISVFKNTGGLTMGSQVTMVRDGSVNGQGPITGTVTNVNPGGTVLTFTANLDHVAPGPYNIQVVTGSVSDACTDCYTVTGGVPFIASANPANGGQGAQNLLVTLSGSNFANGDSVSVTQPGGVPDPNLQVVPGSVTVHSLNALTFRINIAPGATPGPRTITVTDTTEVTPLSGSCSNCFSVIEPPTIASVNPSSRGQNSDPVNVTITGQGFEPGATVSFGPGVVTGTPTVTDNGPVNNDTITVTVNVEPEATTGLRSVTVTNSNGGTATCANCFTVTAKPLITSITPGTGGPGQIVDVTINGSGFAAGTSFTAGPDITVGNVAFVSPTQMTARFTISSNPALGPLDVGALNPDGGRGGGQNVFQIITVPGAPTGVTATAGNKSATVSWTAPASTGGSAITEYRVTCSPSCGTHTIDGGTTALVVPNLANGTVYRFQVRAVNAAGQSLPSAFSNSVLPTGPDGDFVPVNPFRVVDTRNGSAPDTPVGPSDTLTVKVTGTGSPGNMVPADGVTAVVANVTAVAPEGGGNLRVYPTPASGNAVPTVSTLNFSRGQTVPNLVKVKVNETTGQINVHNASSGRTHVLVDIVGYFVDGLEDPGQRFTATSPERLFDTRNGSAPDAPLLGVSHGANASRTFTIADGSPVPNDATAVVLNVTVVSPTAGGFLTVYPAGQSRPVVSNLNFARGQTVPNLVVVKLGTGGDAGKLTFFNGSSGNTNVFADVVGYYKPVSGAKFKPLNPVRILDTRQTTPLVSPVNRPVTVLGAGGVPNSSAVKAVVANVTVVQPSAGGYLTVYPSGEARPVASNLNFERGAIIANLVTVKVGSDGKIQLFNGSSGSTNVIVDIVGYYL